jgi:hypothetical protein
MSARHFSRLLLVFSLVAATLALPGRTLASPPARRVMTWVPPYAIAKAQTRLAQTFRGVGPATVLTDLALQFWKPTAAGSLERESAYGAITDAQISQFVAWGHAQGIRVILCVYNGGDTWDWPLARTAFATHESTFISALVAEMNALNLDGVDLDFEGDADYDADKPAYVQFVSDLAAQLHPTGKALTLDSFADIWNAPSTNWWPDLLPLVDGMTTMGYNEIGRSAKGWKRYSAQKAAAGDYAAKLMLGMPSDSASWKNNTAQEQIAWVLKDGAVGISIWDAQFPSPAWRTHALWQQLGKIRNSP